MKLDKAVALVKSFTLDSVKMMDTDQRELPTIMLNGYASRGFTDTGHKAVDLDGETINQYGIDVSRLETGNIPLLFQHDQSKIIGKVTSASYDAKGLYVSAEVTKLPGDSMTNYVYEAVKAGLLNSFSVGLMVEEIDWTEDDMIEITKSHLFELSVVSTPALAEATFSSTVIKSVDGVTTKAVVSPDALKADNPELCDTLGCLLKSTKKDSPVDVIKEIENEEVPTVVDNTEPDGESVSGTEDGTEDGVEDTSTEPAVSDSVPAEVAEATPEPEEVVEPATEETEEPSKTSEDVVEEEPKVEPEVEPEVTEPEEVQLTLSDAIDLLSKIKIEDLNDEELEEVFETVSTLAEAVEKKVVAEIAAAMFDEEQ